MATPDSSATSPSPTMAFSPSLTLAAPPQKQGDDDRQRAVEKFKARAEISNVTRSLRARLSYASYKATHNVAHVSLRELEAQTHGPATLYARSLQAKRKLSAPSPYGTISATAGNNNYYNNPATQGGASVSPGQRRAGSMAPPNSNLAFRTYYPAVAADVGGAGQRAGMPAASLFTSILAPPPSQPARTILNVADPPVPPSVRPPADSHSHRPRTSKPSSRSIAEGTRAMAKSTRHHRDERPEKRKPKRASGAADKGKQRERRRSGHGAGDEDADGDVDMKAAATLTSLLLNQSGQKRGSAGSPRSSLDESEGSVHSYPSQFAQSSARGGPPTNDNNASSSASTSAAAPEFRRASATPPPHPSQHAQQGQTTPRPAPTDNEAADLMLFLATSPSPARKEAQRDLAAFKALNGGGLGRGGLRGRVLFPTQGEMGGSSSSAGGLTRGNESFSSSVSSIGGEIGRAGTPVPLPASVGSPAPSPAPQTSGAPLLPPPPSPVPKEVYGQSPSSQPPQPQPPQTQQPQAPTPVVASQPPQQAQQQQQPMQTQQAQGQPDFNFSEFLHASPAPARPASPATAASPGAGGVSGGQAAPQKAPSNLGLRADVGRRLFEEEQMRAAHAQAAQPVTTQYQQGGMQMQQGQGVQQYQQQQYVLGSPGKARAAQEEQAQQHHLGAGIDLVQQS
ncbi:hypothetical protein DFH07DRAFT_414593 [Mycena maculata]|uniref:Uncharacterized protein n=1 Tax=Mycena maculata TaxID=230809 RepID=A0AAD7JGB8_9AGAR|nr:hypothetical protein DFH07DRAFT_414593 [Mycena maculata]